MRDRSLKVFAAVPAGMIALLGCLIVHATDLEDQPQQSPVRVDRDLLLGFLADNRTMTLIDARSREEYLEQHLPGAINIPFDAALDNADALPVDKAAPVVIYCRTGRRAQLLRETLTTKGFTNVQVLPREQIYWQANFMAFNCATGE